MDGTPSESATKPVTTSDDPTAASKEQTKDESKSESTPAAATPVEDKPAPAQSEASKPEEKLESTASVTNGNEPAKEKTSETTAENKKTDVVEPPASKGTEETTKEPTKLDEAPKECVTESPVATKIEVKDDVKTEVAVDKSAQKESQKGDGDSEVAQSPPPPLPSTPPPSQVMVFALSGTEKSSEVEQPQIPPPVTEQLAEKAPEVKKSAGDPVIASKVEKAAEVTMTSTPAAEQVPSVEDANLPAEEKKSEVEKVTVQKVSEVSAESKASQDVGEQDKQVSKSVQESKDTPTSEEVKQEESNAIPSEAPSDLTKNEETVSAPAKEKEMVIDQSSLGKNVKLEGDINPEQIAQTIALIDEVTQEAAAITQQKLVSDTGPTVEQKSVSQEEKSTCNAPVPEDKSKSPPMVPEYTSITDTQIPPVAAPSPIAENIEKVEENKEASKTVEKIEEIGDYKPSEPIKEEKTPETQTESAEEKPEQKTEVSAGAEGAKAVIELQTASEAQNESANKPEATLEGIKLETQQESAHTPASKENGVSDHPPAVESVTASSASQSDCKTVEVADVAPQTDTTTHTLSDSGAAESACGGGDGGNKVGDGAD